MWIPRTLDRQVAVSAVAAVISAVALVGCAARPEPSGLPLAAPTTLDVGEHACSYVTEAEARTALGEVDPPRKAPSTTDNAQTYCIFRTASPATTLVVTGGGGGSDAFGDVLALAEQDAKAKRKAIKAVPGGYLVSGTELGKPVVLAGALRGAHWLTVSLRVSDAERATLEARATALLSAAAARLPS
jgi:hypothetical protein